MTSERPTKNEFLRAAKVPPTVPSGSFGKWTIGRQPVGDIAAYLHVGSRTLTVLWQYTDLTAMRPPGHVVMEDSNRELSRHMPIWLAAKGRVLITGLGLGCVLRGLLANPLVEHVDVIEIDRYIIELIWPEFAANPRCSLIRGDALAVEFHGYRWDYAWHDICTPDDEGLQQLHAQLIKRFMPYVGHNQGAWLFPRRAHKILPHPLLGSPKRRHPPETSQAATKETAHAQ